MAASRPIRYLLTITDGVKTVMDFPPAIPVPESAAIRTKRLISGTVSLLFVGDMRTPANVLAINLIIDEILPALRAANVGHRMEFVGRSGVNASQKIKETPHANHLGWVDDLSDAYVRADVVLCPFVVGTGVKIKVLQGMANAKPVVTNALGPEGISAQPGSEFLVAESREGIVKAIIDLAANETLRTQIGAAAAAFIAKQHNPFRLQEKLKEEIRQKLHSRDLSGGLASKSGAKAASW
jgi:glycosyltransferase involved in cell wall biosynthesis